MDTFKEHVERKAFSRRGFRFDELISKSEINDICKGTSDDPTIHATCDKVNREIISGEPKKYIRVNGKGILTLYVLQKYLLIQLPNGVLLKTAGIAEKDGLFLAGYNSTSINPYPEQENSLTLTFKRVNDGKFTFMTGSMTLNGKLIQIKADGTIVGR